MQHDRIVIYDTLQSTVISLTADRLTALPSQQRMDSVVNTWGIAYLVQAVHQIWPHMAISAVLLVQDLALMIPLYH